MGNHKFRLSDMMPNAWFYKLKDMSKRTTTNSSSTATTAAHYSNHHHNKMKKQQSTTTNPQKPRQPSRKSYHFTRDSTPIDSLSHSKSSSIDSLFPDPSTTKPRSDFAPPPSPSMEMRSDRALPTESFEEKVSWSSSCNYEPRNIVIDIDETKQLAAKIENSDDFVTIFDLELRPILTKPRKVKVKHQQEKNPEFQTVSNKIRTSSPGGVKLRVNSPRISSKRFSTTVNGARRSMTSSSSSSSSSKNKNKKKNALAESLAIVKRSVNPQEDFKQSMVEMIVEHQIRSTNDLEELLACYLSLNSDEYHDIIISVFKQIWFQLSGLNNNNDVAN